METRKVQQVGGGTYTVSVPVDWAEKHGLEAGGTAYLYTHRDGSLVVRWGEKEENALAATVIDLADSDESATTRLLMAAYTAGFDRITLRNHDELTDEQRRAVRDCVRGLTGVEITEEADTHIVVQGMLDAGDVSIRQSILQLQFIALSMLERAVAAFVDNRGDPTHVAERDDESDRVFRLVERHLNRSLVRMTELDELGISRPRLFEYYRTAHHLERVANHATKIARIADCRTISVPTVFAADVQAVSDDTRGVVQDASDAVLKGESRQAAQSSLDRAAAVVTENRRLERRLIEESPEQAVVLVGVLNSLIRAAEDGATIAELALRRSIPEYSAGV